MTVLSWGKIEEYWYFIHADEFMVCKSLLSHQLCKYVETVHVVSVMIVIDFMDHISGSEIYLHRFSKSLNCVKDRWHTTLTSRCLQRVLILQHRITEHLRLEGTSAGFWSSLLLKAGPLCGNTRVSRAPAIWGLKTPLEGGGTASLGNVSASGVLYHPAWTVVLCHSYPNCYCNICF